MIYKCVKPFSVPKYDGDGFETSDYIDIPAGSLWELDESGSTIIGADLHLDSKDGEHSQWLEIDKDSLGRYFKEARNG